MKRRLRHSGCNSLGDSAPRVRDPSLRKGDPLQEIFPERIVVALRSDKSSIAKAVCSGIKSFLILTLLNRYGNQIGE